MPDKVAVILIGIPASGKSTFYARRFKDEYVHINLDTLHTRLKEKSAVDACLTEGKSFVVDNTNPTVADRQRYIPTARAAGYRVEGYFFQSVLQDCVKRNENRAGKAKIPNTAVAAISNRLELPSIAEGFDNLYFVRLADGEFVVVPWKEDTP